MFLFKWFPLTHTVFNLNELNKKRRKRTNMIVLTSNKHDKKALFVEK